MAECIAGVLVLVPLFKGAPSVFAYILCVG